MKPMERKAIIVPASEDHTPTAGRSAASAGQASNKVFTIPNLISLIRLCLVPFFFVLLSDGHDFMATALFAIAACTDWIDGQVARRTDSVSKLGQVLDPTVDRILMISGVVGLAILGRLPLWIVVLVVVRDASLLLGGLYLLTRWRTRVPVVYAGKVATVLLLTGFVGLLLNWPLIPGLGVCSISWLPGLNGDPVSWGIWLIYIGLVLAMAVAFFYLYTAYRDIKKKKAVTDGA